jgi:hypothetical protein
MVARHLERRRTLQAFPINLCAVEFFLLPPTATAAAGAKCLPDFARFSLTPAPTPVASALPPCPVLPCPAQPLPPQSAAATATTKAADDDLTKYARR